MIEIIIIIILIHLIINLTYSCYCENTSNYRQVFNQNFNKLLISSIIIILLLLITLNQK
jgi:hypothetical protein